MLTRYFFTRHGESQANVDQVFAGVMDSPLTENGRVAARLEGERLAEAGVLYDLIISSPLSRALETARIIAEAVGYAAEEIIVEQLLLERSFGSLAGNPWSSLQDETAEDIPAAGGESIKELADRVRTALERIKTLGRGKKSVLLVGHGTWYQMAETIVQGKASHSFLEANNLPNNTVINMKI